MDPIIGAPGESLGGNLKLSNDGLTMIAEKTYEVINVYRLIDDKWVHQAINTSEYVFSEYIPNPDTSTIPDNWKGHVRNVALSGNGKVIAVGYVSTTFRTTKDFTVRLYRFEDGSIHQIGQTLEAAYRHDSFGDALELNCDGSIVTIGADTKWTLGNQPGYVRSFANVNDVWHQIGGDILSNYDGLGGLDISSDGRIIVVGQVNDYSGDVQKHNFYGELKVFELVQRDLEK